MLFQSIDLFIFYRNFVYSHHYIENNSKPRYFACFHDKFTIIHRNLSIHRSHYLMIRAYSSSLWFLITFSEKIKEFKKEFLFLLIMKNIKYLPLLLVAAYIMFVANNRNISDTTKWLLLISIGGVTVISMFLGYKKESINKKTIFLIVSFILVTLAIFVRYLSMWFICAIFLISNF